MTKATKESKAVNPDEFFATPAWCVRAILPHLRRPDDLLAHLLAPGPRHLYIEPCAGDGAIARVIIEECPHHQVLAAEIDFPRSRNLAVAMNDSAAPPGIDKKFPVLVKHGFVYCEDVLVEDSADEASNDIVREFWEYARDATVVMNPPFSLALDFIKRSLTANAHTVAALLPQSFLGSEERAAFFKEHPCDWYQMSSRPSFNASLKCKSRKKGCAYKAVQSIEAMRPKTCPLCGAGVDVVTSDAREYGWAVWSRDQPGGRLHWLRGKL